MKKRNESRASDSMKPSPTAHHPQHISLKQTDHSSPIPLTVYIYWVLTVCRQCLRPLYMLSHVICQAVRLPDSDQGEQKNR